MDQIKNAIISAAESMKDDILGLSHYIHLNPELSFKEYKAADAICALLEKHGFTPERNYCGFPTSFRASKKGREGGPKIAFMAEYDALPEIGHGCGHNVIAAISVGAFLASAAVIENFAGEVVLIGTPAEENGGGKVLMLERGGFDDIDFAMMIHPCTGDIQLLGRGGRACCEISAAYHGRAAHSSNPANGINALNSLISLFNHIDMTRPLFHPEDNINGIITHGGAASNVIPDYAEAAFTARSDTMFHLQQLIERVRTSAETAGALTGAKLDFKVGPIYAERYMNRPMEEALQKNAASLGEKMVFAVPMPGLGSSDAGNVSIAIPTMHEYLSISLEPAACHHADFAAAAISDRADAACMVGAKGLAMTAADVLADPAFQQKIRRSHREQVPECYKELMHDA